MLWFWCWSCWAFWVWNRCILSKERWIQGKSSKSSTAQATLSSLQVLILVWSLGRWKGSKRENDTNWSTCGELKVLCDLCGQGNTLDVDVVALKAEWEGFRFLMLQTYSQNTTKEVQKADRTIFHLYPHLWKLAAIALVLPMSIAECERAFSSMKQIRLALITVNLDHLMCKSINNPDIHNFDFVKQQLHVVARDREEFNFNFT